MPVAAAEAAAFAAIQPSAYQDYERDGAHDGPHLEPLDLGLGGTWRRFATDWHRGWSLNSIRGFRSIYTAAQAKCASCGQGAWAHAVRCAAQAAPHPCAPHLLAGGPGPRPSRPARFLNPRPRASSFLFSFFSAPPRAHTGLTGQNFMVKTAGAGLLACSAASTAASCLRGRWESSPALNNLAQQVQLAGIHKGLHAVSAWS